MSIQKAYAIVKSLIGGVFYEKKMTKLTNLCLAGVLAVGLLSGCSGNGQISGSKAATGQENGASQGKLSFAGDIVGQGAQALDDLVAEEEYLFNAMSSDFKIFCAQIFQHPPELTVACAQDLRRLRKIFLKVTPAAFSIILGHIADIAAQPVLHRPQHIDGHIGGGISPAFR